MSRRLTPVAMLVALLASGIALGTSVPSASVAPAPDSTVVPFTPRVSIVDPAPTADPAPAAVPSAIESLDQTFLLHSKPGADKVVYLDFDGATISGTQWNTSGGLPDGTHPAWSIDGDPATFDDNERGLIQDVWRRVSDDFAPFGIDVTTQDPGAASLTRTNEADQQFGMRALITPSSSASTALCGGSCGGIAFVDIYSWPGNAPYQPAWIFPQHLSNSSKYIADATSHEIGHTLGLVHDGTSGATYYSGTEMWGPLMGGPYGSAVTQWSNGAYPDAVNRDATETVEIDLQDDVDIIANGTTDSQEYGFGGTGYRPDESGSTVATAAPLADGYITTRTDADTYALGTCTGPLTVQADPAETGPNLDIHLELLDETGGLIDSDDATTTVPGYGVASGMAATVEADVAEGDYFVRIDGAGASGYDDYGSLGAYSISTVGSCTPAGAPTVPDVPLDVTATPHATDASVVLAWNAPESAGSSPITQYVVTRTGADPVELDASARSHTFTGLAPATTYMFSVFATSAAGDGASASDEATTAASATAPTVVQSLARTWASTTRLLTLTWQAPVDDGGSAITGYRIALDGLELETVDAATTSTVLQHLTPGPHTITVSAVNGVGISPSNSLSLKVPKYASRTGLRAPTTARRGSRPTIKVAVSVPGTTTVARGKVRILVNGRLVTTLTVRGTAVSYRLPRLPRTRRATVVASYLGSSLVAPSRTSRTIRLTR